MTTPNENKPLIAQSSAEGATLTDVLDCPFCGAPAKLHHIDEYNAWNIECTFCSVRTGDYTGPNLPLEEWNTRVQSNK